ncbi:Long-chain-fatty-acid--CoA ligase [Rubripirellula obstinata]|uniref:Long-chain-fatty-acid--CoA ligase n=1 Tax=Rubripirellula obstinata TaxID=406547 RepID=A0A5B1CL13_9BACT|nr:AMP-binding protein [Rubripirellula obstinata]KAA1261887.1 Long-chain-fatty-acid--CoA ligase [Rubripirellula obstinata]
MGYLFTGHLDSEHSKSDHLARFDGARSNGRGFTAALLGQPHGLLSYEGVPAYGLLDHAASQVPDRVAVIDGQREILYRELANDSKRAAATLQRLGVQPGDRVGILLPNIAEYIIVANAIWRCGGIAIAISPLMVASEVTELLRKTDCRRVVCLDVLSHVVDREANPDVKLLLISIRENLSSLQQIGYLFARRSRTGSWSLSANERIGWFWDEINQTKTAWQEPDFDPATQPAYILPTGGTTGTPKAVTLSHTNMVANAWQQFEWTGRLFGSEVMLGVLPFFHSYGMSAIIMSGAAMGATIVMHHRFNTRRTIELLETYRPTVFHAVPAMLVAMNERFAVKKPGIKGLRWVISGGASLEESVGKEFAEHTGALVVEGYGLSEASPVTHVGPLFDRPHYGTIGLPLPQTECLIVDPDTDCQPVPNGEVGELIIRGPQVMLGYWREDSSNEKAADNNAGWLRTGDLATLGDDGFYRIVGRIKDLIITSGFNVYPGEVEAVLRSADGVMDAAVVGVSDPRCGEIVKAFVVMKPGHAWDENLLTEHSKRHLSKHKRPRVYEQCTDDLPRNFLGKVVRRQLRERELSQGESQ